MVDALSESSHGVLHGPGEDCAGHALCGVLCSHAAARTRPLRSVLRAAVTGTREARVRCADRALRTQGRGTGARKPGGLDLVAPALEAAPADVCIGRGCARSG